MKINQNVAQKITINTSVAPAVQQALKMLQMTNLELKDYLEQQSLENPFLIVQPPEEKVPEERKSQDLMQEYNEDDEDEGSIIEKTLSKDASVQQYLLSQINITFSEQKEQYIAKLMLGFLDERGFFNVDLKKLAWKLKFPVETLEVILSQLKRLEPPGVFASDWKESVLIQLEEMGKITPLYRGILSNFETVLQGDTAELCKQFNVSEIDIYQALKTIKNISPYPFDQVDGIEAVALRIPDILLEQEGDSWNISVNTETLPKVLVDKEYFYSIKSRCSSDEEKGFIRSAIYKANWLINALDQRYQNMLKVAHAIVKRQSLFLEVGAKALQPMTLKDIASDAGVHESTVSRATSNKYIQTPQGIYPLKYFFTQTITGSFQDYSAESIRKQIRQIIAKEEEILSDEKIAMMLRHLGVDIARRTVTKYRENMSIPSSTERRRIKKIQQAK